MHLQGRGGVDPSRLVQLEQQLQNSEERRKEEEKKRAIAEGKHRHLENQLKQQVHFELILNEFCMARDSNTTCMPRRNAITTCYKRSKSVFPPCLRSPHSNMRACTRAKRARRRICRTFPREKRCSSRVFKQCPIPSSTTTCAALR